jgi:hypothetical protein
MSATFWRMRQFMPDNFSQNRREAQLFWILKEDLDQDRRVSSQEMNLMVSKCASDIQSEFNL